MKPSTTYHVRVAGILVILLSLTLAACSPAAPKQMTIATASMGGAYYPIGAGIAEIVSKNVKGITMTAEVTGGAQENCRLIGDKQSDIAITNANFAYFAHEGTQPYDKKYELRAIGSLHSSILHIVTLESSSVKTVEDLKGKRIAVGTVGGASISILNDLFSLYGMTLDDIKPSYLSYEDGMSNLKDGNVDAALSTAGFPTSAVTQLINTNKVSFIVPEDDKFEELSEKFPYYSKVTVPAALYDQEKDVYAIGINNVLVINAAADAKTVYDITAAIYDNLKSLATYHASVEVVTLEGAVQSPIPLHEGAQKYFKEKGLIK